MASSLFDPGREGCLDGTIAFLTPTIKVSLVRGYTFTAAHKFVSDVTTAGGTLVSTFTLSSKTATSGVANAANGTWPAVATGAACSCYIIYQSSAIGGGADVASSAQRLIAFTDDASGLPITPNGGDISVTWDAGSNKIFRL